MDVGWVQERNGMGYAGCYRPQLELGGLRDSGQAVMTPSQGGCSGKAFLTFSKGTCVRLSRRGRQRATPCRNIPGDDFKAAQSWVWVG